MPVDDFLAVLERDQVPRFTVSLPLRFPVGREFTDLIKEWSNNAFIIQKPLIKKFEKKEGEETAPHLQHHHH